MQKYISLKKPKTLGLQRHLVIEEGFESDKIFPKGILHKEIHVNTVMLWKSAQFPDNHVTSQLQTIT